MRTVEMVIGYDTDGRPHTIVLVDGHETEVTVYEIDPRAKLLQRGRAGNWILQQERRASQASPRPRPGSAAGPTRRSTTATSRRTPRTELRPIPTP